jgi:hypothetical protein
MVVEKAAQSSQLIISTQQDIIRAIAILTVMSSIM